MKCVIGKKLNLFISCIVSDIVRTFGPEQGCFQRKKSICRCSKFISNTLTLRFIAVIKKGLGNVLIYTLEGKWQRSLSHVALSYQEYKGH